MSDTPLFGNQDEQEAAYAPQQRPGNDAGAVRADQEEGGDPGPRDSALGVLAPLAAASAQTSGEVQGSQGPVSSNTGVPPGGGVLAGAAMADALPEHEERRD